LIFYYLQQFNRGKISNQVRELDSLVEQLTLFHWGVLNSAGRSMFTFFRMVMADFDPSLVGCFEAAKLALGESPSKRGRPYDARVALALFWEVVQSERPSRYISNYSAAVHRISQHFNWECPQNSEHYVFGVLDTNVTVETTGHFMFLGMCAALCRYLEERMTSDDAEWLNYSTGSSGEQIVTCKLAPGSPFASAQQLSGEFYVFEKYRGWPDFDFQTDRDILPFHAIRKHSVIPCEINELKINLERLDTPARAKRLFQKDTNPHICAVTSAFKGTREWPKDSSGKLLEFVEREGVNPQDWTKKVLQVVANKAHEKANVFVFPELMTSQEAVDLLVAELQDRHTPTQALIATGSAHIVCPKDRNRRNQATLLHEDGSVALRQNKVRPFTTKKVGGFIEDIVPADQINLLPTPLGLLVIQICKDFCDAYQSRYTNVTEILDIGLIVVPSMSDDTTIRAHKRKLKTNASRGVPLVALAQQADKPTGGQNFLACRNFKGELAYQDDGCSNDRDVSMISSLFPKGA
jgi:predicted amidohydrolase